MLTQDFPKEFAGLTDPYQILKLWWDDAHKSTLKDANAFALSTATPDGQPHTRIVLAKEIRPAQGVVFFTNYNSDKGQEILQNPKVAATFFWDPIYRQIRILGQAAKVARADSEAYWNTRPRSRQLSQWVSQQSRPAQSRREMEMALQETEKEFQNKPIPCPEHWGGFLISIQSIEFWAGQTDRFHDRYRFSLDPTKVEISWSAQRLYP